MSNINYSLKKENFLFSTIIITITVVFIVIIGSLMHLQFYKKKSLFYETEATLIENNIDELFNYLTNYMRFLGKQLGSTENYDFNKIEEILTSKIPSNLVEEGIFSWTLFDFVTPDNKMVFNSVTGKLNKPIDMSNRKHFTYTFKEPWKLFFSDPVIGNPSGQLVIPAGMGIMSINNKFYGTLVVGLNLTKLTKKIEQFTIKNNIKFLLIDNKQNLITKSNNLNTIKSITLKQFKEYTKNHKNWFEKPIFIDNIGFFYHKQIGNLPYYLILGEDSNLVSKELISLMLPWVIALTILGVLSIILIYYLQYRIIKPIEILTDAAAKITYNQKVRIPQMRYEELNILAQKLSSIRVMKQKLVEAKKIIQNSNLSLEQKISERTQELEQALAAKTEFLNNMSHEIRTPIQGVSAISEGLVEHWREFDDKNKYKLAKQVSKSAKRLYSLVGNLLDLSKFSAGKMKLDFKRIELTALIKEIIKECKLLYLKEKEIRIKFTGAKNIQFVIADSERIGQVLRNLLVNAIKFSPDKSTIEIKLSNSDITYDDGIQVEAIHLDIIDNGIGILENELELIFKPFVQSSKTKTKAGGTGLGLSIAREIITAHHGKIWAENNPKGGAIFRLVIPKTQASLLDSYKIIKEQSYEFESVSKLAKSITVLIVDDEEICLTSFELLLHDTKCKLLKANGGVKALEILRQEKVDVVFLDLMMPDMYGLNVLQEMKRDPNLANISVILQSGTSDEAEIHKAYDMGILSYIKKPYNKNLIMLELSKAFPR